MRELPSQPMFKKLSSSTVLHETIEQFHILVIASKLPFTCWIERQRDLEHRREKIKGYSGRDHRKNFASFYTADDVPPANRNAIARANYRGYIRDQVCESEKTDQLKEVVITALRDGPGLRFLQSHATSPTKYAAAV
jgi:hypothetical protein